MRCSQWGRAMCDAQFEPMDGLRHLEALRRDYQPDSAVAVGEMVAALINAQEPEALRATIQRLETAEAMTETVDLLLTAAETLKTRQALVEAAMARLVMVHDN